MKKPVYTADAPKPIGPYSQGVIAGDFLFVSGQLAIDPRVNQIVAKDIASQTRQVMENIQAILKVADLTLKDVVQTTVYLLSMSLFEEFNREYAEYFPTDFPACAAVGASLKPGALVEVSAVAYKPRDKL